MTETIRIEEDSDDLLEALSVRGLDARRTNGAIEVEDEGLEVVAALEAWLEDTRRDRVAARVGELELVVRSPSARRLDDTGEIPVPATGRSRRPDVPALLATLGLVLLLAAGVWFLLAAGFQLF